MPWTVAIFIDFFADLPVRVIERFDKDRGMMCVEQPLAVDIVGVHDMTMGMTTGAGFQLDVRCRRRN